MGETVVRRKTSEAELEEVVDYWMSQPRHTGWRDDTALIQFLEIFTPRQIKGAMYLATAKGRAAYFRYLCGILHALRRDLEAGREPRYFEIDDDA